MITDIVKISKKIKRKENIFLVFQAVLLFFIVEFVLVFCPKVWERVCLVKQATKDNSYEIVCDLNFEYGLMPQFLENNDDVKLEDFYNWENNNPAFKYIAYRSGSFHSEDPSIPEEFKQTMLSYSKNGKNPYVYKLQVNDEFFKYFSIELSEGRVFEKEDHILSGDTISVILGDKYKKIFKLDDEFEANFYGKKIKCKVIGFLAKNSFFNDTNIVENLEKHIILPVFDTISDTFEISSYDENESQETTRRALKMNLYKDKTSGLIIYGDKYERENRKQIQSLIDKKCEELKFYPAYSDDMNKPYNLLVRMEDCSNSAVWGIEGEQLGNLLSVFIVLIIIISVVCSSINISMKILSLKKIYAIFIANGTKKLRIYICIIREILLINLIPLILLFFISSFIHKIDLYFILLYTIFYLFISFLSAIYPCLVFRKINIAQTFQGDV